MMADRIFSKRTGSLQTEEQTLVQADGIFTVGQGAAEQPAGYKIGYIIVIFVTRTVILY